MLQFINRLVQIYFNSGHTIKGCLTDFSDDVLNLIDVNGQEAIIFHPKDNILMIRLMKEETEEQEELSLPPPELPPPQINYEKPELVVQDIVQQRVSQVQQHHQAVGRFLARSQKSVPTVKYETPNFQNSSLK